MKPTDSFLLSKTRRLSKKDAEIALLFAVDLIGLIIACVLSASLLAEFNAKYAYPFWSQMSTAEGSFRLKVETCLMGIALISFFTKGHYSKRRPFWNEVREVLRTSALLALVEAGIGFLGKYDFSRSSLLLNWMIIPCAVLIARTITKVVLARLGKWSRPMVIIGWGENAVETALAFEGERLMGYSLAAFLVPSGQPSIEIPFTDKNGKTVPWIPLGADPSMTLRHFGKPHVVLALEQGGIEAYSDLLQELGRRNSSLQIVPSIRGLPLYGMEVDHFFAHEVLLLNIRNNLARRVPRFIKRVFDIVVSVSILIVAAPVLAWIAIKVLQTGRPIFYGHRRQGQHNKGFPCYKFRTMAPNADKLLQDLLESDPAARKEWERDFKLKNDPRVTKIGNFLRRTSLDELPQLWNVLKGDMSLVGPRPVVTAELVRYGNQIEYYLEAKPGITGLWQISGRNDISYDSRVYLDAWYVKNWSLFNDIVILIKTVKVIFRKEGAY
jgi:undecaprenyl-phosphate galactose phosphotransferase